MTRAFVVAPVHRGPVNPPPLGPFVDWRPESSRKWWACDAAGNVVAMCSSHADAQAALSKPSRAIGE